MSEAEIITKIRLLKEMQQMVEDAQAEADALKDEIKAYMGEREEIRAGLYKVTYKAVTSSRIDTAELKRVIPDTAAAFTRTYTTKRFCVV